MAALEPTNLHQSNRHDELAKYQNKLDRLKYANDDLRRQLYEANQRGQEFARSLGFRDLEHAERRAAPVYARVTELERELQKHVDLSVKALEAQKEMIERYEGVKHENERLWNELQETKNRLTGTEGALSNKTMELEKLGAVSASNNGASTVTSAPEENELAQSSTSTDLASLRLELSALQARYDDMLTAKERAAARYADDYKKWKRFRQYITDCDEQDRLATPGDAGERKLLAMSSTLRKRKRFIELDINTSPQSSPLPQAIRTRPTQGAAQESKLGSTSRINELELNEQPSHKRIDEGTNKEATPPTTPSKWRIIGTENRSPDAKRSRLDLTGDVDRDDPVVAPLGRMGPPSSPSALRVTGKGKARAPSPDSPFRAGPSTRVPPSTASKPRYEIDPAANGGVNFPFADSVRGRHERRHLAGGECECCCDYYDAVGALPERPGAPLWRSPTSTPHRHRIHNSSSPPEAQAHRDEVSRHRAAWAAPATPPGYWDIGFPDTQQAAEINRRAGALHEKKIRGIEREAKRDGGRYRRVG